MTVMNIKNRILSSLLSVAMLVSMIPSTTFAYTNMTSSTAEPFSSTDTSGAGSADTSVTGVSQQGYQVNIYVFTEKKEDGEWDWTDAERLNKDGDIHLKMEDPAYTPNWWLEGSIYNQTTLGYSYDMMYSTYRSAGTMPYVVWDTTPDIGWDAANELQAYIKSSLQAAIDSGDDSDSAEQWLDYIDDISDKTLQQFGFALPYVDNENISPSTVGYTNVTSASGDLETYFSQPAVINELFEIAADYGAIDVDVYDFYSSTYQGQEAIYKIVIEPEIWRNIDGTLVPYTFRDVMSFPDSLSGTSSTAVRRLHLPLYWNATSAMRLTTIEEFLITEDGYLGSKGFSYGDSTASALNTTAMDLSNTLGVGVITSPDLDSPISEVIPQVIKTYVQVTGIDADGNFEYEYIAEPTVEYLTEGEQFEVIEGVQTNIPLALQDTSETVTLTKEDGSTVTGTAVLNDYLTTPISSNGDTSQITWIDEDLPVVNGTELEASGNYIVALGA